MYDMMVSLLILVTPFVVGLMVGYALGEDHGIIVSMKAEFERDAKEWDKRCEHLIHELKQSEHLVHELKRR